MKVIDEVNKKFPLFKCTAPRNDQPCLLCEKGFLPVMPLHQGSNFFTVPEAPIRTAAGVFIKSDNGDIVRIPMSAQYLLSGIPAGTRVNIEKSGIGINTRFRVIKIDELPPPIRNVFLTNIVDEPKICRCPAINLLSTGHDAGCPEKKR